jgi:SAM-dependent methyltransferase
MLILSAGNDWVVHRRVQRRFYRRLGSPRKEMVVLPGFYHEVFHERERALPIGRAARFLAEAFAGEPVPRSAAARNRERFAALSQPLPVWSPRRAGYAIARLALSTLGRLSHGLRLGWASGFESGRSLNHVYANRPRGSGVIGRLLDRVYLNAPGWRGIRTRAAHLRAALAQEIAWRRQAGRKVHLLDVAGGPGRYLVDTLAALDDPAVTAQCRDLDAAGLDEGRALARARGVTGLTYARADAFDPHTYQRLVPRPDIIVISGLFELFADNRLLARALRCACEALPADGTLIVTNQPRHPQLDFIARVLDDRNGRRWVMRPRPQAELDGLLRAAGLVTERCWIDNDGIFSVNLASRLGAPT